MPNGFGAWRDIDGIGCAKECFNDVYSVSCSHSGTYLSDSLGSLAAKTALSVSAVAS